jgi:hypothetical protein
MGEKRNAYTILVRKPEGKRPLGRPRRRWVDSIKINLREVGLDGRDQWRALVNTVMNLRVPSDAGNFLSSCTIGSFSRRVQLRK